MKCVLTNLCENKLLCCNFCKVKKCWQRCIDDHKKCNWFEDASAETASIKEAKDDRK